MKIVDSNDFISMLEKSQIDESTYNISYNDEITSIECIGDVLMQDIDVTGNHLYYANDILTHNSAVNSTDASNDSVSDSIGTVQTADFIIFLLQDEQMKEEKKITCKVTKNRFTGRTDSWNMNIDYEHMRFMDAIGIPTLDEKEIKSIISDVYQQDVNTIKNHNAQLDNFNDVEETVLDASSYINGLV